MDHLNFKIESKSIKELKDITSDLSKINSVVKFKIEGNKLLLYSLDSSGESANATVRAFKSYLFSVDDFFDIKQKKEPMDEMLDESDQEEEVLKVDWIVKNVNVLNKKLSFFTMSDADVKGQFKLRKTGDAYYSRLVIMTDNKFKFSLSGDEPHKIRDISINQLNDLMDPTKSEFSINVPTSEFENARKASSIDQDEIISINLRDGRIYFSQDKWELLIGKTDFEGKKKISFDKKYLKSINPKVDEIQFSVFPTFILYQEGSQKLMISFEQNF